MQSTALDRPEPSPRSTLWTDLLSHLGAFLGKKIWKLSGSFATKSAGVVAVMRWNWSAHGAQPRLAESPIVHVLVLVVRAISEPLQSAWSLSDHCAHVCPSRRVPPLPTSAITESKVRHKEIEAELNLGTHARA